MTNYTPQDAIARIQTIARGLTGMVEAPEYPPENMMQFPFAMTYYRQGNTTLQMGWRKGLHTVFTEFHLARQLLPGTVKAAMPFYERFLAAIEDDPTLDGTVSTVISPILHTFGWLEYGSQDNKHIGWRFEVTFKQETTS